MTQTRDQIRRDMRQKRRQVPCSERMNARRRFAIIADRAHLLRPGARIAVYQAYGHEADVSQITRRAWSRGCEVFLPVITARRAARMEFFRFEPTTALRKNSFGIAEPETSASRRIPVQHLDLILMPLVAYDDWGWRLGSGAGFYDRCLHQLRRSRQWRRPKLVGVAFAQQRIERLAPNQWDVPMDAVITPSGFKRFPSLRQGIPA
jgi:5-formyltetrahydrofolate cyclo-ligase